MITRDELYELVWSLPMTKVCERFGVSSSYMVRVCTSLDVPRPPMGYWSKLAVGKAPPVEPLPDAKSGQHVSWDEKGPPPKSPAPKRETSPRVKRTGAKPLVFATDTHPLFRGLRSEYVRSRPVENGGYLKPYKRLLPDVSASLGQIDRALSIASRLYNELEALGASVAIAPSDQHWHGQHVDEREVVGKERTYSYQSSRAWSSMRPTIALFQDVAISISVVEMSAEVALRYVGGDYIREAEYQANPRRYQYQHTFTTSAELPIGRLRIFASAPGGIKWSSYWQEKEPGKLEALLPVIAKEIRRAVPTIVELTAEAQRQAEIQRQEWMAAEDRRKRADDLKRTKDSVKESHAQLERVIDRWKDRMALSSFSTSCPRLSKMRRRQSKSS